MAESIFEAINSSERMGKVLDIAEAPAVLDDGLRKWLTDPANEKRVREIWDQVMCLAYIDGPEAAAEWLKERVTNPKHKLPSAAQEFLTIYKRCKQHAIGER